MPVITPKRDTITVSGFVVPRTERSGLFKKGGPGDGPKRPTRDAEARDDQGLPEGNSAAKRCSKLKYMPSGREIRKRIIETVDRWDPKFSGIIVVLVVCAAWLTRPGSWFGELFRELAEWIHWACVCAGSLVVVLQCWNWVLKRTGPHTFVDPRGTFPERDTSLPGLVFNSHGVFGYPKMQFVIPSKADLEHFVEWSDEDPAIAEANNLTRDQRRVIYHSWYKASRKSFLMLQSKQTFGAVWETIAISIILALPKRTIDAIKAHTLSVIDLRYEHLRFRMRERKGRFLLYDTLIFAKSFKERYSDFKSWHSVLHLSQFPAPTRRRKVLLIVEPDNDGLKASFKWNRYGPHTKFAAVTGHEFFVFDLPAAAESSTRARSIVRHWEQAGELGIRIPRNS